MTTGFTADAIRERFETEKGYIEQYVDFLENFSEIEDARVHEINQAMFGQNLPKLKTRPYERKGELYTPEEIKTLVESIEVSAPAVRKALREYEREQLKWPLLTLSEPSTVTHPDVYSEWVNYLMTQLSEQPDANELEEIKINSLKQATEEKNREGALTKEVLEVIISDAVDAIMFIKSQSRRSSLQNVLDQFDQLKLLARVSHPATEVNVFRQGFISLMTVFDAAVFDLGRVALHSRFFRLIGTFGKDEKIKLSDISGQGGLAEFRDMVIEDQLKKRYVKDLLLMLEEQWEVDCVDKGCGQSFGRLMEIVFRRNLHVHNRGIVDKRYRESGFNLDNFNLDDSAPIDQAYWKLSVEHTHECIRRVAAWAGT